MHLLLVDADLNFQRVLETVLSNGGIRIDAHSDPMLAWSAFRTRPADLVLVDMPPEIQGVDQFLGQLRQDVQGSQVPVILMSEKHHPDSKAVANLLKKHQVQQFLPRPFEMFGIAQELKKVAAQGGPSLAERRTPTRISKRKGIRIPTPGGNAPQGNAPQGYAPKRPDLSGFRLLKDIWIHNRTGVLRRDAADQWILICKGGLQAKTDTFFIEAGLRKGDLTFQPTHQDCSGDSAALGRVLWAHAQDTVTVSFEIQLDKRALQSGPLSPRAMDLPLSLATRKVLQAASPHLSLGKQLRSMGIPAQDIARQLGALKALGLITLVDVTQASPRQVTAPQRPRVVAPPTPEAVLKRLDGEYERIKNTDDFTILGLPKDADDPTVRATWDRLKERYSALKSDPDLPQALRHRAEVLLRLSKEATKRVLTNREVLEALGAVEPTPGSTKESGPATQSLEDLAYSEGQKAFSAGDHKRAVQCFRKAHDERIDSARNMAWLGWSVFHQPEKPEEERNEEALDLLRLASSFDPTHRQGQFFLAYVELKTGQATQAIKRLQVLLKRYPDHTEAKKLMRLIQTKARK
jgi:CheY-like chemotaxis protein/tetratricopeptide (TPR) repeat protein